MQRFQTLTGITGWICVDANNLAMKYRRDALDDEDNQTLAFLEDGSYVPNDGAKN